jgi:hypothetical protein
VVGGSRDALSAIIALVLVAVRVLAAAALATFALRKLVAFPRSADRMWRPPFLRRRSMRAFVLFASGVELSLACAIALIAIPRVPLFAATLALGIGVSAYGLSALAHGHDCGCGASRRRRAVRKRRILLARNVLLFGVSAAVILFGPSW